MSSRLTDEVNRASIKYLLVKLGGIPAAQYAAHPITLALQDAGITVFTELITLTETDINTLEYTPHGGGDKIKLELAHRKR